MQSPEESLRKMGIELPDPLAPKGIYRNVLITGNTAVTSGHLPSDENGDLILGKVGVDLDLNAGFDAARIEAVSFGYNPDQFPVAAFEDRHGIVSVGADRGRDFSTLLQAVEGSDLPLHLYADEGHLHGA